VGQIIPPYSTLIFTVELLKVVKPDPDYPDPEEAPAAKPDSAPSQSES
jgi:hypothetical protein